MSGDLPVPGGRADPVRTGMRPHAAPRRLLSALVLIAVLGGAAWLVPAMVISSSGGAPGARGHDARTGAGPTAAAATTTTTTTGPEPPLRNLDVTRTEQLLVDAGHPLVRSGVVVAPDRQLPTYVWTPDTPGRFPLVVFVHGYDRGPLAYERFCSTLASSGYVVAAPSFPLEDPTRGLGLDRSDLPDEAFDVSSVITTMENDAAADRIDVSQVAVVGHSDGADVALEVGYELGTADHRVQALVAVAPDPVTTPLTPSTAPLLLVQGTADSVVPYASSQAVFDQLPGPTYYVSLLGADHLPPIAGGTPWTPVLDTAVAEFLDATVAHRGPGVAALVGELGASPLVRLATRG